MLLLAVFIAAVGCVIVPPLWHRLFPPKDPDFDALIDLISSTIRTQKEGRMEPFSDHLSLILGSGQEVHEKAADLSPEEPAKLEARAEQAEDQPEHSNH
jgi:hypothetical protein